MMLMGFADTVLCFVCGFNYIPDGCDRLAVASYERLLYFYLFTLEITFYHFEAAS